MLGHISQQITLASTSRELLIYIVTLVCQLALKEISMIQKPSFDKAKVRYTPPGRHAFDALTHYRVDMFNASMNSPAIRGFDMEENREATSSPSRMRTILSRPATK